MENDLSGSGKASNSSSSTPNAIRQEIIDSINLDSGGETLKQALADIPEARLTPALKKTLINLTQGIRPKICPFSLEYIITEEDIIELIKVIVAIPEARLAYFESTVNRLNGRHNGYEKYILITELAGIPENRLAYFTATAIYLSQRMNIEEIPYLVFALSAIPEKRFTVHFAATAIHLTKGLYGDDQIDLINILAAMPKAKLAAFAPMVNRLFQDITIMREYEDNDEINKHDFIRILADIPEARLANFEATVNRITQGTTYHEGDECDKCGMIWTLAEVPEAQLANFANIPDHTLQQLSEYVPYSERRDLIRRLSIMEYNLWQAEITEIINDYSRDDDDETLPGVAFEVHNYANTQVTTSSSSATSSSSSPMRLDDAVMQNMAQRLQTGKITPMAYAEAATLLKGWIKQKYSNSNSSPDTLTRAKHAAFAKLASDTDYEQVISTAVSFLQQFHPESVDIWLDGFLTESITAYGNNGESCSKGIKERVATGMRNIDPELDTLFAQAEGPKLASTFLASLKLNDPVRCEVIIKELEKLGLNAYSTEKQAGEIFERYMKESLASYGVSADKYLLEIQRMKELVAEGGFETYIKPILKLQEDRALKAAEYAVSLAQDHASAGSSFSSTSSLSPAVSLNSGSGSPQALGAALQAGVQTAKAALVKAPATSLTAEQRRALVRASWAQMPATHDGDVGSKRKMLEAA